MPEVFASEVAVPLALLVILVLALGLLILFIWSIRRHRDPDLQIESDDSLVELMPSLQRVGHAHRATRGASQFPQAARGWRSDL